MTKEIAQPKKNKLKQLFSKKKVMIPLFMLLLVVVGYGIWKQSKNGSDYTVEPAKIDSLTEVVSETGNVTTAGITPIYTTTTGIVEEVLVNNGEVVAENQHLFSVKSTSTKQEQNTALASYMSAKSALESAKATQLSVQAQMLGKWDSYKELAEGDEYEEGDGTPKHDQRNLPEFQIPKKEWLSAEANYKNQQQIISEKSVAASAAWQGYQATQDSKVNAILGGVVRNLGVANGDLVVASRGLDIPPALLIVDEAVDLVIKLAVNESDAIKISEGQKAEVEFDAIPAKSFSARVDRLDTIAAPDQGVIKYSVYLVLEEEVNQLQRGMTTDVEIIVASKENVLTVPSSAVKPYQGGKAVRVVDDKGEIEFIPVEIGSKGNGRTEIVSGIKEGREVIVTLANDQVERSGGFF